MWKSEITYIIDTPVPSCDKDVRVVYTNTDGRELIKYYSMNTERYPTIQDIENFVLSEVDIFESMDILNTGVVQ